MWAAIFPVTTALLLFSRAVMATQYKVGGQAGWSLAADYATWASAISFKPGDTLLFSYSAGNHSVLEVNQNDYVNCNTASAISSDKGKGNTVVTLKAEQTYHFICGTNGHCSSGMKVTIPVTAAESSSINSTASTPTISGSPSSLGTKLPSGHGSAAVAMLMFAVAAGSIAIFS